MTVVNDLISVEAFVKARYPSPAHTYKQVAPLNPAPATFIIRLAEEGRASDTGSSTRVERTYQVVYVGATVADVLTKMGALSSAFMDGTTIPVNASARFIRVGAFSYTAPFNTENDMYASIGVLMTEVRENRTQDNAPLIGEVVADVS